MVFSYEWFWCLLHFGGLLFSLHVHVSSRLDAGCSLQTWSFFLDGNKGKQMGMQE